MKWRGTYTQPKPVSPWVTKDRSYDCNNKHVCSSFLTNEMLQFTTLFFPAKQYSFILPLVYDFWLYQGGSPSSDLILCITFSDIFWVLFEEEGSMETCTGRLKGRKQQTPRMVKLQIGRGFCTVKRKFA